MAKLENEAHEVFALERATGATLEDAYATAGFVPDRGHASRLAARPEVRQRIAELREDLAAEASTTREILAGFARIVARCEESNSFAALKEARLALVELKKAAREREFARFCHQKDMLMHFFNTIK